MDPEQHGRIVRNGYDIIAEDYYKERSVFENGPEIERFISGLPEEAVILDVGCGGGIPVLRLLADRGFIVKGIDFSKTMLDMARRNVPEAELILGDVTKRDFDPESLDGIISTYAIIHIHRSHHALLYRRMFKWLRPGGVMLVSTGKDDWSDIDEYFGVPMVWNHPGPKESLQLVKKAGFEVIFERLVTTGGETHYWVLARK